MLKRATAQVCFVVSLVTVGAAFAEPGKTVRHRHYVAPSAGIGIAIDEGRLITFMRPVKTVFMGNPTIADVNLVDPLHAFVLGKTLGLTNLIALDAESAPIENKQVMVTNSFAAVTLNRGPDQYNYTCTLAHCEAGPRPGDPKAYVDNTEQAIGEHQDLGTKNAMPPSNLQPVAPSN